MLTAREFPAAAAGFVRVLQLSLKVFGLLLGLEAKESGAEADQDRKNKKDSSHWVVVWN